MPNSGDHFEDPVTRLQEGWTPPTEIDRRANQVFGGRGHESSIANYKPTNRLLMLESWIERRAFNRFSVDRNIVDLRGQRPTVTFTSDGEECEHTFDFLCVEVSGLRTGVIVKPERHRRVAHLLRKLIIDTSPDVRRYMGRIRVMTDRELNEAVEHNDKQILIERMNFDPDEFAAAVADVSQYRGDVMFYHLIQQGPKPAARRTALWNMVDCGMLVQVGPGRLKDTTYVRFVQQ